MRNEVKRSMDLRSFILGALVVALSWSLWNVWRDRNPALAEEEYDYPYKKVLFRHRGGNYAAIIPVPHGTPCFNVPIVVWNRDTCPGPSHQAVENFAFEYYVGCEYINRAALTAEMVEFPKPVQHGK